MKSEDIQFLKDLQHELLTQDKVSQADPRFWVIRDYRWDIIPDEYAEDYQVYDRDGDCWTLSGFIEYLKDDKDNDELLADVDWSDDNYDIVDRLVDKLNEECGAEDYTIHGVIEQSFIVPNTMFLTIAEAKQHLKLNHYHYTSRAHAYAMTAWRAPKVERLIKLLQMVDFDELLENE